MKLLTVSHTFTQFHQFNEDDHGYDDFADCGVDDNDDNDDDDDNFDGVFDECENEFRLVLDLGVEQNIVF